MTLLAQTTSSTDASNATAAAITALSGVVGLVIGLVFVVFFVICYCLVAKKAGYNPWLGLLMFIPLVNFIVTLIFVFSEWPVSRENKQLRAQLGLPPHGPI